MRLMIIALSLFMATVWPFQSFADAPLKKHVDQAYQFAFEFPADWKIDKNPPPGEAGEVRIIVRHPTKLMHVMALVGDLGKKTPAKGEFESNQNRDAVVRAMIEWSLDQVYEKTSRTMGADRMVVSEKRALPSDAGISFYISTVHFKGNKAILIAGIHVLPFEKPHMVTFVMTAPIDPAATKDNEAITDIFNSFRVLHASSEVPKAELLAQERVINKADTDEIFSLDGENWVQTPVFVFLQGEKR